MASFARWFFLYSISIFVVKGAARKATPTHLKNSFLLIGRHTLAIMCLHFLSFKIVNAIVVVVYHLPAFCIAAFPNLYGDHGLWWLLFTVVGVMVPLGAGVGWSRIKRAVSKKIESFRR